MNYEYLNPGFEHVSPSSFPTTIIVTPIRYSVVNHRFKYLSDGWRYKITTKHKNFRCLFFFASIRSEAEEIQGGTIKLSSERKQH